jgi:hypothetical protein
LLDLAVALESLDYTWDQVKALAGPRAVLLERAVEMTVRLLGIPHPQKMTYHFSDYEQTLASWMEWQKNQETPGRELLSAGYWSCEPSQALRYRFEAALTPEPEVIREVALPDRFLFLYPLIHILRLLWRRD